MARPISKYPKYGEPCGTDGCRLKHAVRTQLPHTTHQRLREFMEDHDEFTQASQAIAHMVEIYTNADARGANVESVIDPPPSSATGEYSTPAKSHGQSFDDLHETARH